MTPDSMQTEVLSSRANRLILNCSRQWGKSQVAAALAVNDALLKAPALVLLLSPTLRQSGELFRDKVLPLYNAYGRSLVPAKQESALTLTLANGSRIISLPGDEGNIRGYSGVRLLVIDEAARVPDGFYRSVRPFLAVSRGRLVVLSTPWGKRGWFYEEWISNRGWQRFTVKAKNCPRISPEFLQEERESLGDRWFRQEYENSFEDTIDAVFAEADIQAASADAPPPLWGTA